MAAASIELEKDLYRIVPMGESHLDEVLAIEKVSFPTPWSRSAFWENYLTISLLITMFT